MAKKITVESLQELVDAKYGVGSYIVSSEIPIETRESYINVFCTKHDIQNLQNVRTCRDGRISCKQCHIESLKKLGAVTDTETIIREFIKTHGNRYNYSKVEYVNSKKSVIIICNKHGEFKQIPKNHIAGSGCHDCNNNNMGILFTSSLQDFIDKSISVHGDLYGYDSVEYKGCESKVKILCRKHGYFYQIPVSHTQGKGCSKCAGSISKGETEIYDFISKNYSGEIIRNDKSVLGGLHLDIFIPNMNIAIEYNGIRWHSNEFKTRVYHKNKTINCSKNGVRLIHIWEDEWIYQRKKIEDLLMGVLIQDNKKKLFARKLILKNPTKTDISDFVNEFHFQGHSNFSRSLGLYYEDMLVQIMTLKCINHKEKLYEIGRLVTRPSFIIIGGANKLFKNLLIDLDYDEIISMNNLDKFTGNVYNDIGMDYVGWSMCSYYYKNLKKHPWQFIKKLGDEIRYGNKDMSDMSDMSIATELGYLRVFTSGNSKYSYKNPNI